MSSTHTHTLLRCTQKKTKKHQHKAGSRLTRSATLHTKRRSSSIRNQNKLTSHLLDALPEIRSLLLLCTKFIRCKPAGGREVCFVVTALLYSQCFWHFAHLFHSTPQSPCILGSVLACYINTMQLTMPPADPCTWHIVLCILGSVFISFAQPNHYHSPCFQPILVLLAHGVATYPPVLVVCVCST